MVKTVSDQSCYKKVQICILLLLLLFVESQSIAFDQCLMTIIIMTIIMEKPIVIHSLFRLIQSVYITLAAIIRIPVFKAHTS